MVCLKLTYKKKTQARKVRGKRQHTLKIKLYIYKCKDCRGYHLTKKSTGKNPYVN